MNANAIPPFHHSRNFSPDADNPFLRRATEVVGVLAKDAAERDRLGGRPGAQIALLKESGLLSVSLPRSVGGGGEPVSTALRIVREFAKVDGSIAHLYGYHIGHQMLLEWEGTPENAAWWWRRSVEERLFWANTANSFSRSLSGRVVEGGYILDGYRPFASGSHVADYLIAAWEVPETGQRLLGVIPASREGITIEDDWDGIGQRQTGSGQVTYRNVFVATAEVLTSPQPRLPRQGIGTLYGQNVLANVFVGSAQGALLAARDYTLTTSRPWVNSGVEAHAEDPWVKRVYGTLYAKTLAAALLVDQAGDTFDALDRRGRDLTAEERSQGAAVTAAANALSGEVALEVTNAVFEVMGARSATNANGYDRFWRNVRTHTLHNPAEYKTRNVGYWFLTDTFPGPSTYE